MRGSIICLYPDSWEYSMQKRFQIQTDKREELVDITEQISEIVQQSEVQSGMISVYAQGATAAIMIQENWDDSVQKDVINFLRKTEAIFWTKIYT